VRILYLAPNIPVPGTHGGSTHVTSVYRELLRRHEVLLLSRAGSTEPGVIAIGTGVGVPVVRHLLPAYYFARAAGAVRRFRPDVIYERYSAFGLGVAFGRLINAPSVLMTLDRDASPISFHYSARIVATSDEFIPPRYRDKYRKVHWGVDVARFEAARGDEVRRRLAPRGERLIVYTGSCTRWHGLDVLVDVAARWSGPPVVIALVGDGGDRARIEALARSRGVPGKLAFTGRVPHEEVGPYVAAADLCIAPYAPSQHEIFRKHGMNRDPIKVLEYMAAGKPAVTIDTPRIRELFRAGEEVLLYPAEDPAALEALLVSALGDPERLRRVGAAGAELVRRRYTWAQHADELDAVFAEVTGRA
jgi:glycosyltransferase involved in cell wall biosynthesis